MNTMLPMTVIDLELCAILAGCLDAESDEKSYELLLALNDYARSDFALNAPNTKTVIEPLIMVLMEILIEGSWNAQAKHLAYKFLVDIYVQILQEVDMLELEEIKRKHPDTPIDEFFDKQSVIQHFITSFGDVLREIQLKDNPPSKTP